MNKVLVLSMGKAGSTSVMTMLNNNNITVGRIHAYNVPAVDVKSYTHFIVMVREPIARAISDYWETGHAAGIKSGIDFTLEFIPGFVYYVTGIDVFKEMGIYSPELGYFIYNNMLVIRTEDFNHGLVPGIEALLGVRLAYTNDTHLAKGSERFGDDYLEFIKQTKFSASYLNNIYNSEYCRKFGYDEFAKWVK